MIKEEDWSRLLRGVRNAFLLHLLHLYTPSICL